jgi:ABC-type branched-subunit amino acid transport system substrate-binding protein
MKRRWLVVASLVAVFALVAAACGDDTTETTATTEATTTTAGATTTAATTTLPSEPEVSYDVGVTPAPCPDAVNEGNGCIYLGVISDLSTGPFAPLGQPLTQAQEDYWDSINAAGGLDGFDVLIRLENTRDAHYDPAETAMEAADLADDVAAMAQVLGTPQTQAALGTLAENDIVSAPATWFSGWAFSEIDQGLILESGAPYCFEAMNGMDYLVQARGTDFSWALVVFPGDYGGDYGAGAKIAAAQLGLADPVAEILQVPLSFGGDIAPTIAELLAAQPDVIVMVTGPSEMAGIAAGLFQNGFQTFQILGAAPTWNVALKANPDLVPLLQAVYTTTDPWGGWDADTAGHAAMREAAATYGREPHNAYIAGWVFQYPLLALLQEAIAGGDLTRGNLVALAETLEGVDYQGMLPTRSYVGDPNDFVVRATIVNGVDPNTSDGLTPLTDFFTSQIAADFNFAGPCFTG